MKIKKLMIWIAVLALLMSFISVNSSCVSFSPSITYWSYIHPGGRTRSFAIRKPNFIFFELSNTRGKLSLIFMKQDSFIYPHTGASFDEILLRDQSP